MLNIQSLDIFTGDGVRIINPENFVPISNAKPITAAQIDSLVFIVETATNKENLIRDTLAMTIICDCIPSDGLIYRNKCLIISTTPKFLFAKIVNASLRINFQWCIHPSAVIHPEATIAKNVYIGAHVSIGKSEIGEHTIIHSNVSIYDNVNIGQRVIIDSGAVIGAAGFGFVRDEDGVPHQFPQLGAVVIEDDVEIGANTCIDRGALEDTIIRKGVKIDNLVHIAHNVEIGKYSYIISQTIIAGSTKIGEKCWIAPSFILNKIKIGDNVTIGFGSVVLKSVPSGETYMGNPALSLEKYSKVQYKLKKL